MIKTKLIIITLTTVIFAYGCSPSQNPNSPQIENQQITETSTPSKKIKIYTSIYPNYFLAKEITKEKAEVKLIPPIDAEPHGYEISSKKLAEVSQSDLLIINGGEIDEFAQGIEQNENLSIINLSEEITNKITEDGHLDSHFWLDLNQNATSANKIYDALILKDSTNADFYKTNLENLLSELEIKHTETQNKLSNCEIKTAFIEHNAFSYFSRAYGVKFTGIKGHDDESGLSSKKIASLINEIKSSNSNIIFTTSKEIDPEIKTIANETSSGLIPLNTIENLTNSEEYTSKNFLDLFADNVNVLYDNLKCSNEQSNN